MDWGAWQVTVHGVRKESDTTEQLHFFPHSSLIGRRISKPSILMEETPWLWHLCLPPSLTQPLGQWGGFSGWEGCWTCSTLPGFGGLRSQHSAGSKRHPLHLSNSFAPTPSSAHGYRPLCLGFVKSLSGWCTNNLASSHGTASTEHVFAWAPRQPGDAAWRLSFMEHLIARHLQGQELKLAEELLFQWFLPPLNYFSFKNKFLNISPQFYAKPQSSI